MMRQEKRKKTKMLQFRVIPEDFKTYEEMAIKKKLTKTELFELFLELIKSDKI
jgi:hypothetical protein